VRTSHRNRGKTCARFHVGKKSHAPPTHDGAGGRLVWAGANEAKDKSARMYKRPSLRSLARANVPLGVAFIFILMVGLITAFTRRSLMASTVLELSSLTKKIPESNSKPLHYFRGASDLAGVGVGVGSGRLF
jgi:hypothetical protein